MREQTLLRYGQKASQVACESTDLLNKLAQQFNDTVCHCCRAILMQGDSRDLLLQLPDRSIDFVVTDPPYFIDRMGANWDDGKLARSASRCGVIGGLPVAMKFDRRQGLELLNFMLSIAAELFRVLKPGAFCVAFSQGRLYHRMASAFDDAGFEIRDLLAWKYEGQAKAFSQTHFIKRDKSLDESEKTRLIEELEGFKTPQLKPQMEPMVLAQKPREGTFVENWRKHGVGLVNFRQSLDGRCPGTVMEVSKRERNRYKIGHLTVKPLSLIDHLIRLFSRQGHIVLDPFMGSGTHGLAAVEAGRQFIGFEKEKRYIDMAFDRLRECGY